MSCQPDYTPPRDPRSLTKINQLTYGVGSLRAITLDRQE
jgi:hypothetical protein